MVCPPFQFLPAYTGALIISSVMAALLAAALRLSFTLARMYLAQPSPNTINTKAAPPKPLGEWKLKIEKLSSVKVDC